MPCDIAARCRATSSPYRESAGLAIWEFSSPRSSAIESRRLGAVRATPRSPKSSERMFISTAPQLTLQPSCRNWAALVGGLGVNGSMVVAGAPTDSIEVLPLQLLFGKRGIKGWAGGIPTDSEDTLRFAEMTGVRPRIEKYPLAKAADGYARMMSGKAEFRV